MAETCLWCGSQALAGALHTSALTGDRFRYIRCADCRSVSISPLPSAETLAKAYAMDYYGSSKEKKFIGPIEKIRNRMAKMRARRFAGLLKNGDAALDFGCGNGNFLNTLSGFGSYELYGCELPGPAAERAVQHPGLTIITEDTVARLKSKSFAFISLFHVLEHLEKPAEMLRFFDSIVKPGGYLTISMPEPQGLQARIFGKHWLHLDPPRHLCLISRKQLTEKLKSARYEVVSLSLFSLEQNPFGFIQSLLNRFNPRRDELFEWMKGNRKLNFRIAIQILSAGLLLPFALLFELADLISRRTASYTVVFRKTEE